MKFYGNIEHNLDIINKKYADEHYADKEDIKSTNLLDGEGEKSVEQIHDTNSWNTSNEQVKIAIKKHFTTSDGAIITGHDNIDSPDVTINVGAYGKLSTMMNGKSQTVGGKSHAEGSKTIAFENNSHAEGNETFAAGKHSHAEGNLSSALGNASHTEGVMTIAQGDFAHAEGQITKAEGVASHAEGTETQAFGNNSHAEGNNSHAMGMNSHAEGTGTYALETAAHTEGTGSTASGRSAHAEGSDTVASNSSAHAEGIGSAATGAAAHAEGVAADATNEASHAEGYDTTASGRAAHAEGSNTTASDQNSHAEGEWTQAKGYSSHAEGGYTEARGPYNHVSGFRNISDGDYQTVIGKANKADSTKAFIIGNGEIEDDFTVNDGKRKNAMEVDWEGNAWVANDIKIGKNNTSVKDKLNNIYSKEASNFLLGAESVSLSETVHLSGNILQENNIYTESPSFNLNQGAEITSRWFGYIGVKNVPLNKNYLLVAEIDINTEFNMNIARVQSFYKEDENSSSKPEGTIVGIPNNGKNYILFPFTPTSGRPIKGFYFDAQGNNSPTVSLLVQSLRLYETTTLENVSINDGYKDWKKEFYYTGNLVKKSLENDYVLIYDTNSNIIASSLSDAQEAEIILYKSKNENYTTKEEFNALQSSVAGAPIYMDVDRTDNNYFIQKETIGSTTTFILFKIASRINPIKVKIDILNESGGLLYILKGKQITVNINKPVHIEEIITEPLVFNIEFFDGNAFKVVQYEYIDPNKNGLMLGNQAKILSDLSILTQNYGITFEQCPAKKRYYFEPGCLYYVRANTETIHFYKNGEMISYYTDGFDNGVVAMASNIYQGAHVNYFAAPKLTGGIFGGGTMNGYTITTTETDEVYAMSVADSSNNNPSAMNVWKIRT